MSFKAYKFLSLVVGLLCVQFFFFRDYITRFSEGGFPYALIVLSFLYSVIIFGVVALFTAIRSRGDRQLEKEVVTNTNKDIAFWGGLLLSSLLVGLFYNNLYLWFINSSVLLRVFDYLYVFIVFLIPVLISLKIVSKK